jgi:hypothetical protein
MSKLSRQQRREMEESAKRIRLQGQIDSWSVERIVEEIIRQVPEILRL